jgi:hypothetical protein
MSEAELSRLRRDLDVIQNAAGLELSFGWGEVKQTLALIPCGAIIVAWAAFGPWEYIFGSLLPCLLLAVIAVGRSLFQYRRSAGRRERKFDLWMTVLFLLAVAVLMTWERTLGLPRLAVRGAAFFIAGVMSLAVSFTSPARRAYCAGAVALIPFSLALPLCTELQIALAGGCAMMVAGLVAGGIMAWQLRGQGRGYERSTD